VFVLQRLAAIARRDDVDLEVVAPVPRFPILSALRSKLPPKRDQIDSLSVYYPRHFYIPAVLKKLDGGLYARGLMPWVTDYCRRHAVDLLDAHFVWPDGVGVWRLARKLELPYTITLRGWLYEAMSHRRILSQCLDAMRDAAAVISVSGHLAKTAAELGVSETKLHVIPNGVDTNRFVLRDKLECREKLGLPMETRLVVAVGHLGPRKGQRENVQAMARLPEDVRLVIVGDDPAGGRNERELRDLIDRLGLNGRVLLAGQQPYDRIPKYLSAADVSVLASHREGCPNVVLESLACGTPVVATDVGAVPDLIQPGVNGEIVPVSDVESLAEAIARVLARPASPQAIRQSQSVKSWARVAEEVHSIFRSIIEVAPT
jgi:glycosyltransferase involved in cell wall biosynthesis